ncbi:hypothetical protein Misp01_14110 [Microtetraspora sp. NBRC 13810]|nr:hypothetical protein Misp01_14110 [Microtetraspora sp. NBRC 13810]
MGTDMTSAVILRDGSAAADIPENADIMITLAAVKPPSALMIRGIRGDIEPGLSEFRVATEDDFSRSTWFAVACGHDLVLVRYLIKFALRDIRAASTGPSRRENPGKLG